MLNKYIGDIRKKYAESVGEKNNKENIRRQKNKIIGKEGRIKTSDDIC